MLYQVNLSKSLKSRRTHYTLAFMMLRNFIALSILLSSFQALAFDIWPEVQKLNAEFKNYKEYPILIFNKPVVKNLISNKSIEEQQHAVISYVESEIGITISPIVADSIIEQHTITDSSATAKPIQSSFNGPYTFCAVFPSGSNTNHQEELERFLGVAKSVSPYPSEILEKAKALLSLEELKLYSLYHELAHCLDENYAPNSGDSVAGLHQAENYAEAHAGLLLSKRLKSKNLLLRRSLLRSMYTKYMGQYFATADLIVFDPNIRKGGSVYFLSPVLLAAQKIASTYNFRIESENLEKINDLSINLVEAHGLDSRDIAALHLYLTVGKNAAVDEYRDMLSSFPEAFVGTYINLKSNISILEEVDLFITLMTRDQ